MSPEAARAWAGQYESADSLREAVARRLLDDAARPVGYQRSDEEAEDVIVALLRDDQSQDFHPAVVAGWQSALTEVQRTLDDPLIDAATTARLQSPFARVFRVAEQSAHPMLRARVFSALALVLDVGPKASALQVQQVVGAACEFDPAPTDRSLWAKAIDQRPEIAGYAFRMLLKLKLPPADIANYFANLLKRRYADPWDIDVWFLAEYINPASVREDVITQALRSISVSEPTLWNAVAQDAGNKPFLKKIIDKIRSEQQRLFYNFKKASVETERVIQSTIPLLLPTELHPRHELAQGSSSIRLVSQDITGIHHVLRDRQGRTSLSTYFEYTTSNQWAGRILFDAVAGMFDELEKKGELRQLPARPREELRV